jgi:hypothetical protein
MGKENYSTEIGEFVDTLFSTEDKGYVYSPTKDEHGDWETHFFKWPQKRQDIILHILSHSLDFDVYLSPSLFKAPSAKQQAWKGTHYVWIEFDGNVPENLPKGIPEPTIRVQSSETKHEHWYWRLNDFNTDGAAISGLCKSLTYTLDADKSGWDYNQVLRPPGSLHQESTRRVRLLDRQDSSYGFADFKGLVKLDDIKNSETKITDVPDLQLTVAKYSWDADAWDLFNKETQPVGARSSAMTRLGFHCVEMGMTNDECFAILYDADERWGKYKHRSPEDRAKRLTGIISHCRGKKELDAELRLSDRESFISLGDFRSSDIKVKWLYDQFLTERGLGIISASPGIGKTTVSIRLGFAAALGLDFFVWPYVGDKGRRVAFLSLEMSGVEVSKFVGDMWPSFKAEQQAELDKNFFLLPLGYSLPLADKKHQQNILDEIDKHEIDFLIIDSLKAATALDERKLDVFFEWINKNVREERNVTVWIVHHNRKPPNETGASRRPKDLGDLYGDTFITAHPTAVISLYRRSKNEIEVIPLKVRLAEQGDPFVLRRTEHLNFELKEIITKEAAEEEADNEAAKEKKSEPKLANGLFG